MIADLDETIRQLLIDELPIKNGEIDIAFNQPTREWSARVSKPTINLYLYDVRENPHLRANQWEQVARQGGRGGADNGDVILKRTPLRLDCFYMLTTWATEPSDEHRLLSRVLLALFRFPIVPEDRLARRLQNPTFDIHMRLASHDILTNPAELWSSLDNEIRPSVSYVATLAFDPWEEVAAPAVRVLSMTAGQEQKPQDLHTRRLQVNQQTHTINVIGGTVRSKDTGTELVGLEVEIENTGLYTRTDGKGRYRFTGLQAGSYRLSVRRPDGSRTHKAIALPSRPNENYDLEI